MARDLIGTRDLMDVDVGLEFEAPSVRDIYDAEFGRLAGWTTRLVSDPDLAHDLATEAFVKLLRHRSTVAQPPRLALRHGGEPRARPLAKARP